MSAISRARILRPASRIREVLDWTPELDDLGTIVRHALAWERHLMAQAGSKVLEEISA